MKISLSVVFFAALVLLVHGEKLGVHAQTESAPNWSDVCQAAESVSTGELKSGVSTRWEVPEEENGVNEDVLDILVGCDRRDLKCIVSKIPFHPRTGRKIVITSFAPAENFLLLRNLACSLKKQGTIDVDSIVFFVPREDEAVMLESGGGSAVIVNDEFLPNGASSNSFGRLRTVRSFTKVVAILKILELDADVLYLDPAVAVVKDPVRCGVDVFCSLLSRNTDVDFAGHSREGFEFPYDVSGLLSELRTSIIGVRSSENSIDFFTRLKDRLMTKRGKMSEEDVFRSVLRSFMGSGLARLTSCSTVLGTESVSEDSLGVSILDKVLVPGGGSARQFSNSSEWFLQYRERFLSAPLPAATVVDDAVVRDKVAPIFFDASEEGTMSLSRELLQDVGGWFLDKDLSCPS